MTRMVRERRGEMAYLSGDEYKLYGLDVATPDSLVSASSDLIDAHCRRSGFGIAQYMERFRVGRSGIVRLSYLPLASADGVIVDRLLNPWDRLTFKDVTGTQAFERLRRRLIGQ